jgi:hypothetical protein
MKTAKHSITVLVLCVSLMIPMPSVWAQPLAAPPAMMPGQTTGMIGVAAAVQGKVDLTRTGQVGYVVDNGLEIFLGDKISTDEKGRLQILLLDETVFTIGPNSELVIDEFVYDPKTNDGVLKAEVVKGVFRFVTGKIAHKKPTNMEVNLPAGQIGIRGTIVAGKCEGLRSLVVLMGPGDRNNSGNRAGRLTLSNEVNGKTEKTEVSRAGFGAIIEGAGSAPGSAFEVPVQDIAGLMDALKPAENLSGAPAPGGAAVGEGQSASDLAGETTTETITSIDDLGKDTDTGKNALDNTDPSKNPSQDTGVYHFVSQGDGSTGTWDSVVFNIDYDNHTVGGGNSHFSGSDNQINGGAFFKFNLATVPFATPSGDGDYHFSTSDGTAPQVDGGPAASLSTLDFTIQGGTVSGSATLTDGSDTVHGGGTGTRFPGAA